MWGVCEHHGVVAPREVHGTALPAPPPRHHRRPRYSHARLEALTPPAGPLRSRPQGHRPHLSRSPCPCSQERDRSLVTLALPLVTPDTAQTRVPRARLATGRGGQGLRRPLRSQPRLRHSRAPCGPSPNSGTAHRPPLQPRPPGRRRSFKENQTSHAPALLKRFWGSQHPRGQAPLAWPLPVSSEGPRPCPLSAGCPTRSHRHLLPRASPHGAPAPRSPWGLRVPTHTLQAFLTPRVPGPAGRSPRANPLSRRREARATAAPHCPGHRDHEGHRWH